MFADLCYLSGEGERSWSEARSWCKNNDSDSDLVSIHSPLENDQAWHVMKENGVNVWIGFSDRAHEGEWLWMGESSGYSYKHWDKNEPDGGTEENCAFMSIETGAWRDTNCLDKHSFMCKVNTGL